MLQEIKGFHCLRCHHTFDMWASERLPHVNACPGEPTDCGKLVGKECEYEQERQKQS
jgi:hypothetical protein